MQTQVRVNIENANVSARKRKICLFSCDWLPLTFAFVSHVNITYARANATNKQVKRDLFTILVNHYAHALRVFQTLAFPFGLRVNIASICACICVCALHE